MTEWWVICTNVTQKTLLVGEERLTGPPGERSAVRLAQFWHHCISESEESNKSSPSATAKNKFPVMYVSSPQKEDQTLLPVSLHYQSDGYRERSGFGRFQGMSTCHDNHSSYLSWVHPFRTQRPWKRRHFRKSSHEPCLLLLLIWVKAGV